MGVRTVAVYSDADASALHVAMADEAVHIGASPVGESYLRGDKIIAAALATGAEAIHPGYGFLSENPDFVDQVTAAGLVFIGPSAAVDPRHGAEGRGQAADGKGRRASGARLSWRGAGAGAARHQGARDRLSRADQGARRRRRQGHAPGRASRRFRRSAVGRAARGQGRLRRRPRAGRKICRQAAPHRGAGVRRQFRQRRASLRARLLGAAPPPEGDRGSARPRHDGGNARGDDRCGGEGRQGDRLFRRRHDRVHRRCLARAEGPTASGSWR